MLRAIAVAVSTGFQRTEGASTITQQLLKNNVFTDWTQESTIESIKRKIQEQYLAVRLEKALTADGANAKDVILENYLNTVNFGAGAYGVQTASQTYFGKDCKDLTLSECAVLAAIPQNPTRWNPLNHPEWNAERRETVLDYMLTRDTSPGKSMRRPWRMMSMYGFRSTRKARIPRQLPTPILLTSLSARFAMT